MFLFGKNQEYNMNTPANASDDSLKHELEGLRAIGEYALKQKNLLQQEEIRTSDELKGIQYSFDAVRQKSEDITNSVTDFQAQFSRVQEIVDRFESIISKMESTSSTRLKESKANCICGLISMISSYPARAIHAQRIRF